MTRKQIMMYFGVSRQTICNWEKKGFPVVKNRLGRCHYNLADCKKWLKGDENKNEIL